MVLLKLPLSACMGDDWEGSKAQGAGLYTLARLAARGREYE